MRRRLATALVVALWSVAPPLACGPAAPDPEAEAVAAAELFLARYLQPGGRIERTDEGGDTVSEGQAYGLLMAVALGDEEQFRLIWAWTDEHLQRDDGLLAWRWADGSVVDDQPAADADLLAAAALALASQRFGAADLRAEADVINAALLDDEALSLGDTGVLLAGLWARDERLVNPSYWATPAMSTLWWVLADERWASVAGAAREALDVLTTVSPHLPPDWASVDVDGGAARASESPDGDSARYGYEAARVLVQLAADCQGDGQRIAARAWPFLEAEVGDDLAATYSLDGEPLDETGHPLAVVAAAASAAAAADSERADELLDLATALESSNPSYYGAAWVALARLWLDTDRIGGCRPGDSVTP